MQFKRQGKKDKNMLFPMEKSSNSAIIKKKQAKFCFLLNESGSNLHVKLIIIPGIVQVLTNSLSKVDIDLRMNLYNEIVLAGGNTMFDGFPERYIK